MLMIAVIKNILKLQASDRILLDTNICLFIFGPGKFRYLDSNSSKYVNAQDKWGTDKVYICRPVLSEFINRLIHDQWKIWKHDENPHPNNKKAFRNSSIFKGLISKEIAQYVEEMLNGIECCDSGFDKTKACEFLSEFIKCELDFNDIIIEEICRTNNLILVTDDGDFKNCGIPIITANDSMFQRSS